MDQVCPPPVTSLFLSSSWQHSMCQGCIPVACPEAGPPPLALIPSRGDQSVAGSVSRLLSRRYPGLCAGADGPFQPRAGPRWSVEHREATPSPVNPLKERIIRSAPKPHLIPAAQTASHGRAWMNPELIFQALLFLGPGVTPVRALRVPKGVCGEV